jgi:hypothetical protein
VYCNKRYFYLEAQSYLIDGHPELFLWLWFLGKLSFGSGSLCKLSFGSGS